MTLLLRRALLVLLASGAFLALPVAAASAVAPAAQASPTTVGAIAGPAAVPAYEPPVGPNGPTGPGTDSSSVTVDLGGLTDKPSTSVTVIIAMTLISLLPAILLTCTSFTKILVVLGLTRNALGLHAKAVLNRSAQTRAGMNVREQAG